MFTKFIERYEKYDGADFSNFPKAKNNKLKSKEIKN